MRLKIVLSLTTILCAVFAFAPAAHAATMFLSPATGSYQVGQNFDVIVHVASQDKGFNAAQSTIQFPKDVLEVKSVDSSPANSIFNFWLDAPRYSNANGTVSFVGGTTSGVLGTSISILKITFTAKNAGDATVAVSDAAVTASDGSGTNILTATQNARFTVMPSTTTPEAATSTPARVATSTPAKSTGTTATPTTPPAPSTQPIVRTPTRAQNLPEKPKVYVPLAPDPLKWSNMKSDFIVAWQLPSDVAAVSAIVNANKSATPPQRAEGLYEAKSFPALKDGVWYAHVMFKNNIGWGPVTHYRLAIDTVAPQQFKITSEEGTATEDPAPTLHFKTTDNLSGVEKYIVQINNEEPVTLTKDSYKMPVQAPGKKLIRVQAIDGAGNTTESTSTIDIIPLPSPTVTLSSENLYVGEDGLVVSGTALPDATVLLEVKNTTGGVVAKKQVAVDPNGNWQTQFTDLLSKGSYYVSAITQDAHGAQSIPVHSDIFSSRERPLLTLAGIEITQAAFFTVLILMIVSGMVVGFVLYYVWRIQVRRKIVIAQRDVMNTVASAQTTLDKLLAGMSSRRKTDPAEARFLIADLKDHLEKARKYIVENIREIEE